jgi:hypothetical protein
MPFLTVAPDAIGLGADMAADHLVDAGHFLEEACPLLLHHERRRKILRG